MQFTVKFSLAVHYLLGIVLYESERKITSEFMASSCGVNPVIMRTIMRHLQGAGIISVSRGAGGAKLAKKAEDISLDEIFNAVAPLHASGMFKIHHDAEFSCPIGRNIAALLDPPLKEAQEAMEAALSKTSLADLAARLIAMRDAGAA